MAMLVLPLKAKCVNIDTPQMFLNRTKKIRTKPGIFIDGREQGVTKCIELKLDSTFLHSNQFSNVVLQTCFSSGLCKAGCHSAFSSFKLGFPNHPLTKLFQHSLHGISPSSPQLLFCQPVWWKLSSSPKLPLYSSPSLCPSSYIM